MVNPRGCHSQNRNRNAGTKTEDEAENLYCEALEHDPLHVPALVNYANLLIDRPRPDIDVPNPFRRSPLPERTTVLAAVCRRCRACRPF